MTTVAAVISSVPQIGHKTYLELGTFLGRTYNAVSAYRKTGVDIQAPWRDDSIYIGSTDDFFAATPKHVKWDVIFIDAGHAYPNVLRDYNHAARHLAEDGYLFIHDLYPPNQAHVSLDLCGDGYKLLAHLRTLEPRDFELYVTDPNDPGGYGLTLIRRPPVVVPPEEAGSLDYQRFIEAMKGERLWGLAELAERIALP